MSGASSTWGFGTTFCGRSHVLGDGSYVTTKWVVLAGVPVLPLSCWRHLKCRDEDSAVYAGDGGVIQTSESFYILDRLPLRWRYFGKQALMSLMLSIWIIAAFPVFSGVLALNQAQRWFLFYFVLIGYYIVLPAGLLIFIGILFDRIWKEVDA